MRRGLRFRLDDVHVLIRQDLGRVRPHDECGELFRQLERRLRADDQVRVAQPPARVRAAQVIKGNRWGEGHGNGR